jgi:hypothetical protein
VLYASADGQFVMQGNLYQIQGGKPVNLTEKVERLAISKTINGIPTAEMVVYPGRRRDQVPHHRLHRHDLPVLPQAARAKCLS